MTTIYKTIRKDHDKHRQMLESLEGTSGDTQERRDTWNAFYYDVKAHAAAEEESFYAPLMEDMGGQSEARHSVAEHKELDDLMEELHEMDFSSTGWLTKFKTLKHDYLHHIEEEEQDIFPVAKDVLSDDKSGDMGAKFEIRKSKERKKVDAKADHALTD